MTVNQSNVLNVLQWSRGLVAAETALGGAIGYSLTRLQWSRGLVAAETARLPTG